METGIECTRFGELIYTKLPDPVPVPRKCSIVIGSYSSSGLELNVGPEPKQGLPVIHPGVAAG
jgi:hypothetical protein